MGGRVTKTQLRDAVAFLQRQGYDIAIHWAYGQPRVTDGSEARDISPRLRMSEMDIWLHGFECGTRAHTERYEQLRAAIEACLSDLERHASTHGPGPDKRLERLRQLMAR